MRSRPRSWCRRCSGRRSSSATRACTRWSCGSPSPRPAARRSPPSASSSRPECALLSSTRSRLRWTVRGSSRRRMSPVDIDGHRGRAGGGAARRRAARGAGPRRRPRRPDRRLDAEASPTSSPPISSLTGAVELWWGDERCVPPEDERSNYRRRSRRCLDRLDRPPAAVTACAAARPDAGAAEYEDELAASASSISSWSGSAPTAMSPRSFPASRTRDRRPRRRGLRSRDTSRSSTGSRMTFPRLCSTRELLFLSREKTRPTR